MPRTLIYHATAEMLWQTAKAHGVYAGTAQDRTDGFIHFSATDQIVRSVERYLSGHCDLVLLSVDPDRLGAALVWALSRDGLLFPHLYGVLPIELVERTDALPLGLDGKHRFPTCLEHTSTEAKGA